MQAVLGNQTPGPPQLSPTQSQLWAHTHPVTLPMPLSTQLAQTLPSDYLHAIQGFICHPQVTQSSQGEDRLLPGGTWEHAPGGQALRGRTALSRGRGHTTNKGSGNKSRIHLEAKLGQWLFPVLGARLGGGGPGA